MPSPSPDTARLDDALDRANRLRYLAKRCRRNSTWRINPQLWLAEAKKCDAHADAIMSAMKDESHG